MISLITAVVDDVLERYLDTFQEIVIEKTSLVSEVLLPKMDSEVGFRQEWVKDGITFKMFGAAHHLWETKGQAPALICLDHALGLHAGIDEASNDYVFLSDPDVFFYTTIDEFYYTLMQTYDLNLIGLSHFSAVTEAFGFFPNVFNMMFRKEDAPSKDWLSDLLTLNNVAINKELDAKTSVAGKYLMPGKLPKMESYYPNPKGHFETGSVFLIWAKQQNWRWLSFQTTNVHLYTTKFYRSSFGLRDRFKQEKLVYHATNGSTKRHTHQDFLKAYNDRHNDNSNRNLQ